jgi:hypothetical protein
MSDQREQDSNLGGWGKRRFNMLSGPAPWMSPKMTPAPLAQGCGVFIPQNVETSKQEGQKKTWQLASCKEVATYHTSTRLQHTTLAHL